MKGLIAIGTMGGIATWSSYLVSSANHGWLAVAIPAILITIWLVLCFIGSIWSHLEDLATLAASDIRVGAAEKRLEDVRALAADKHGLPDSLLALAQEDNPVTKYMGLVDQAIRNVEEEKNYQARVRSRIAGRAAGPFSLVVSTFGSSLPADT